jgi:hypothetical protein
MESKASACERKGADNDSQKILGNNLEYLRNPQEFISSFEDSDLTLLGAGGFAVRDLTIIRELKIVTARINT